VVYAPPSDADASDAYASAPEPDAPLRVWQAKFAEENARKDAEEKRAREERRANAKVAMRKWLAEKQAQLEARKATNREEDEAHEAALDAELGGPSWDRVHKLLDKRDDLEEATSAPASPEHHDDDDHKAGKAARLAARHKHKETFTVKDAGRMRDILIGVKAKGGLPKQE
jgi:uncharacterized protein YdiU (UPF0061 family)